MGELDQCRVPPDSCSQILACDLFFTGRVDDIMVCNGALPISSVLGALRR
jgi:hypothetical protein